MKYLSLVLLVGMVSAQQHCRKIDIDKSSGFCTVPDLALDGRVGHAGEHLV
jgi:hypothetical protein